MRRLISIVFSIGAVLSASLLWAATTTPSDAEKAGRQAFIKLKCTACHQVLGDTGLPALTASEPAPVLGGLNAEHSTDELVLAITNPSHSFAPGFRVPSSGVSRMGTMGDSMTLHQLRDIVAYLKSQEESGAGWRKEGP